MYSPSALYVRKLRVLKVILYQKILNFFLHTFNDLWATLAIMHDYGYLFEIVTYVVTYTLYIFFFKKD